MTRSAPSRAFSFCKYGGRRFKSLPRGRDGGRRQLQRWALELTTASPGTQALKHALFAAANPLPTFRLGPGAERQAFSMHAASATSWQASVASVASGDGRRRRAQAGRDCRSSCLPSAISSTALSSVQIVGMPGAISARAIRTHPDSAAVRRCVAGTRKRFAAHAVWIRCLRPVSGMVTGDEESPSASP